jgi:hypothetical protein
MPLPVHTSTHNTTASTANLARSILTSLDHRRVITEVNTATLALLLGTLIDLAEPRAAAEVAEAAQRTVRSLVAQVTTAERDRDEDLHQERGSDPPRRAWG